MKISKILKLLLAMARVHSATIKEDTDDDDSSDSDYNDDSNYEEHTGSSDSQEEVEEKVNRARVRRCNMHYHCKVNRKCVGFCVYKVAHS